MAKTQKITKGMTIAQVTEKFPQIAPILMGYGFHCAGCPAAQSETIEDLANVNQMDLQKLLEDLNKAIGK
jgi:hybrid cluster-associated redox disulfide protein